ncbi:MAG: hypothetical protein MUO77_05830 [Anaerolineales bacterium]|nr:hypothetical protein [Anaerolineales bacterium]
MNKYLKIGLFGFLTWLVPFMVGFLFYSPKGQLVIDALVFKAIMIVVGSITGAFLLVLYFKKIDRNYLPEGIAIGSVWFVLNILLDLLILVPMAKMAIGTYFAQIGFEYLTIPTMSIAMGLVAKAASEKK